MNRPFPESRLTQRSLAGLYTCDRSRTAPVAVPIAFGRVRSHMRDLLFRNDFVDARFSTSCAPAETWCVPMLLISDANVLFDLESGGLLETIFALPETFAVDQRLRRSAEQNGIEVRGTLWLVERLVIERLVTGNEAAEAYAQMRAGRSRLPWDEVELQLERWGMSSRRLG